jgi:hypothetical protein
MHFIADSGSSFYKSNIFINLINLVSAHNTQFKVKQTESRLSITVRNIMNIHQAIDIFRTVLTVPADN